MHQQLRSLAHVWMMIGDDNDGQMIFGDLGGLKLPDICLTGEEKPEKTSPRKLVPTGDRTRARCVTGAHATAWPTGRTSSSPPPSPYSSSSIIECTINFNTDIQTNKWKNAETRLKDPICIEIHIRKILYILEFIFINLISYIYLYHLVPIVNVIVFILL